MTKLTEIRGQSIEALATEPSNLGEGQVWYNTTSGLLNVTNFQTTGVWSSGGSLATPRYQLAGCGTQTAGLAFGGYGVPVLADTEEYNGSAWTAGGSLGTGRSLLGGAGTQTAGLAIGGQRVAGTGAPNATNSTEEYNGSTWASGGNMGTGRYGTGSAGNQTAALAFGGNGAPANPFSPIYTVAVTEEYDGSSWTAGGSLALARRSSTGAGTQTAGLAFGGYQSPNNSTNSTEEYNGSTWTSGGIMGTNRSYMAGAGTQTAGLAAGGNTTPVGPTSNRASTEEYDGTSWTSTSDLGTARKQLAGAGTQPAALAFGGNSPTGATEEYNKSPNNLYHTPIPIT